MTQQQARGEQGRNQRSRQAVIRLLRERGTLSRAEIARVVGLSPSTVSTLVGSLVAEGMVMELGGQLPPAGGRAGRPGTAVMLNPASGEAIGIDFGYRHVHVIIADVTHAVQIAKSAPLPADYDPSHGLDAATDLVRAAMDEAGTDPARILGVGVSLPGPYNRASALPNSGLIPTWSGIPVAAELGRRLHLPVVADNDANLGALAERQWGAGADIDELVYVKLHNTVGAAFVSNGRLTRGAVGGAGEIGHLVMDDKGPLCRCGNRGCLESYVGLPNVMRSLEPGYGDRITLRDVITKAWQGDRGCIRALAEAGRTAGRAVGMLCTILDPAAVVVGGALAAAGELVLAPLREAATAVNLPAAGSELRIIPAALGAQACALGAVALVLGQTGDPALTPTGSPVA
ncbi:ROK family transcriptional regulator [Actinospica sp.]|jgi:predicted NBD/HSP70 family sugar kinase|uniref:ROK family transcriptional regulator n=1 Tax=Actinospica sp. TaxID=1872142 RepID=UPI002B9521E5|nr:ROK family transcriptional regulator [Actinospica sp.]HWG23475.1 ROK family transcriptional regulator [Actinospica sp.]